MIKVVTNTEAEVLPTLHHGSIVELEEIQEEKKETPAIELYNSIMKETPPSVIKISKELLKSYFEELGLVRIEDVLKVFDETRRSIFTEAFSSPVYLLRFTDAIKGLAHANP